MVEHSDDAWKGILWSRRSSEMIPIPDFFTASERSEGSSSNLRRSSYTQRVLRFAQDDMSTVLELRPLGCHPASRIPPLTNVRP